MVSVPAASCTLCWAPGYQYFIPGDPSYPTGAGGDGINHFGGGGGNFDAFPGAHSPWATEGKQTTDTSDPGALRFGALAGTFVVNPTATDWFLIGFGGQLVVPQGGATLQMVLVDTFYPNNTGGYTVTINTPSSTRSRTVGNLAGVLRICRVGLASRIPVVVAQQITPGRLLDIRRIPQGGIL